MGLLAAVANTDLDPARFRALVDSFRERLARFELPGLDIPTPNDAGHQQIIESIRALLQSVATATPGDFRMFSQPVPVGSETEHLQRIREFLRVLEGSWLNRVVGVLGNAKLRIVSDLLRQPGPDLLGLLGRCDDENAHSDVLRWLLDPRRAKTIAPAALERLCDKLDPPETWRQCFASAVSRGCLSVRREYAIGSEWSGFDLDRIDIVISTADVVLAIENKVWSPEHDGQTDSYWQWLCTLPLQYAGIFLTPEGMPAQCGHFKAMSYLELLDLLLEGPTRGEPLSAEESVVLAAYTKTLASRILRSELRTVSGGQHGRT